MTSEKKLATLGIVTMLIERRKDLDRMQESAAMYLEGNGGKDAADWVGEAVYNSGDDPQKATDELIERQERHPA